MYVYNLTATEKMTDKSNNRIRIGITLYESMNKPIITELMD